MVPNQTTLLHPVEAPLKFPDVIFHAGLNEAFGLIHVLRLVRIE
jgi:hypothetical protein